jgi:hypothetical protein
LDARVDKIRALMYAWFWVRFGVILTLKNLCYNEIKVKKQGDLSPTPTGWNIVHFGCTYIRLVGVAPKPQINPKSWG